MDFPSMNPISRVAGVVRAEERGKRVVLMAMRDRAAGGRRERIRRGVLACEEKGERVVVREVRYLVFIL